VERSDSLAPYVISTAFDQPCPDALGRLKLPRHIIAVDALDARTRGEVEALQRTEKGLASQLSALLIRVLRAADGGEIPSDLLVDEAVLRVRIECVNQRLDQYSALPPPAPSLHNSELPPPFGLFKVVQAILRAMCGPEFSPDVVVRASSIDWTSMTDVQRAWTVCTLAVDMLETAPERAGSVKAQDIDAAVHGDAEAWARLQTAYLARDEGEPIDEADQVLPSSERIEIRSAAVDGLSPGLRLGAAYRPPHKGRFLSQAVFLHEVGWILTEIGTSEFPSLEAVSAWSDRRAEVKHASVPALKRAIQRWFEGKWPLAREAATEHYRSCTEGPSCVPREVPPEIQK
jgi:hypothetical protein